MAYASNASSVCIISDTCLFAEAIRRFLTGCGDVSIVGVEGDAAKALEMVRSLRPDVIVVEESGAGIHSPMLKAIIQQQTAGRIVVLAPDQDFMVVHDWRRIPGTLPADFLKTIQGSPRGGWSVPSD
jgi:DNA-binding NarL/FixJ family response regulator